MRRAFTLIELMITIAIIAVLTGIIAPRASVLLDSIHLRGATSDVVQTFAIARATAIREGTFATVKIDSSANAVLIQLGTDTVRLVRLGSIYGVTVRSNRDSMSFSADGIGYGAGNQSVIVSTRRAADTIVVSRLGRVRH